MSASLGPSAGPARRQRHRHDLLLLVLVVGCAGAIPPRLVPAAVPGEVVGTLLLIGDAGAPRDDDPVLAALGRMLREQPERSTAVFLGDNVYPLGIPPEGSPGRVEAIHRLQLQLDATVGNGASAILVAGNHDWARGGEDGWSAVRRQTTLVRELGGGHAALLPGDGCPGPVVRNVPGFRLVALDSQWWLHRGPRPSSETDGCPTWDSTAVVAGLHDAVSDDPWQSVVIAHHPLESHGEHGGHFPLLDHLFPLRQLRPWLVIPLPLLGSAYPIARRNGISSQDQSHPDYRRYRGAIEAAVGPGVLAYAAGHEHSLQVLDETPFAAEIVSGAGYDGHTDAVTRGADTRFAIAAGGFVRLDRLQDGRVRLAVLVVADGVAREVHSEILVRPAS